MERLEREHGRGHQQVRSSRRRGAERRGLESLEETLDVVSSTALMGDLRAGVSELATDDAVPLTRAEALDLIRDR